MKQLDVSKKLIKSFYFICAILLSCLIVVFWQQSLIPKKSHLYPIEEAIEVLAVNEPIQPIPLHIELDEKKVQLGEKLFNEPQLSRNNTLSCRSCHERDKGEADGRVTAIGMNDEVLPINTLTVFNSGFNFRQHWSGDFESLEEQIDKSISNPKVMDSNWEEIIKKLKKNQAYVNLFSQVYAEDITDNNIKDAIATFERSLYTPNSRFDKFLLGDSNAITKEEKEGYRIFKNYGCVSCHQGVNVGGNLFQKFGVLGDYFRDRGKLTKADLGRFNVTGDEPDKYVFKVPSLRNITLTAPYFHDGSAETLKDAIGVMAKYQLGRQLSSEQIDLIIKFLTTLTGEYQGKPL